MTRISKYALTFILFMTWVQSIHAQKLNDYSIAWTTETISLPFSRYLPIHPGLEIGAKVLEKENRLFTHRIRIHFGGYHHRRVENGFYLNASYIPMIKLSQSIGIDLPIGLGYQHSFYPGELYEQNNETGEFDRVTQLGRPHALINFGFGFTYHKPKRVKPFIRHENVIDLPLYNGLPNSRTFLKTGIILRLK